MFRSILLPVCFLAACSAVDPGPEVGDIGAEAASIERKLSPQVTRAITDTRLQRYADGLAIGHLWELNDDCAEVHRLSPGSSPEDCRLVADDEESLPEDTPVILRDRLAALTAYLVALDRLGKSKSEIEIVESVGVMEAALGRLGSKSNVAALTRASDWLKDQESQIETVAEFAINEARIRRMKKIITSSNPSFATLVRQIQAGVRTLGFDPGYARLYGAMIAAEDSVEASLDADPLVLAGAYMRLEAARDAYVAGLPGTMIGRLANLATLHDALAKRLGGKARPEDVLNHLQALRSLRDQLAKG